MPGRGESRWQLLVWAVRVGGCYLGGGVQNKWQLTGGHSRWQLLAGLRVGGSHWCVCVRGGGSM